MNQYADAVNLPCISLDLAEHHCDGVVVVVILVFTFVVITFSFDVFLPVVLQLLVSSCLLLVALLFLPVVPQLLISSCLILVALLFLFVAAVAVLLNLISDLAGSVQPVLTSPRKAWIGDAAAAPTVDHHILPIFACAQVEAEVRRRAFPAPHMWTEGDTVRTHLAGIPFSSFVVVLALAAFPGPEVGPVRQVGIGGGFVVGGGFLGAAVGEAFRAAV